MDFQYTPLEVHISPQVAYASKQMLMAVICEKYPPAKAAIPEKNIEQDASDKDDTRLLVYTGKQ